MNDKLRILIVDDEPAIRRFLNTTLGAGGYHTELACNGMEALAASGKFRPDLIILDLGLPDIDGLVVLQQLRQRMSVPVIILTARDREDEKVRALDAGADDYVTKPFGMGELLARMRVVLRRPSQASEEPVLIVEDLKVDLPRHRVTMDGEEVRLTPTEYELLHTLAASPGKVLTHRQLIRALWGDTYSDGSHLLRVNISGLRRKLEPDPMRPNYIITEPGVGYRLRVEP